MDRFDSSENRPAEEGRAWIPLTSHVPSTLTPSGRRALGSRLAQLPLADPEESTRRLLFELDELTRQPLQPRQRLRMMSLLEVPAGTVVREQRRRLEQAPQPFGRHATESLQQTFTLLHALAGGFQETVDAFEERHQESTSAATFAMLHTMRHLGTILELSALFHLEPPPHLWHRLHQLYQRARTLPPRRWWQKRHATDELLREYGFLLLLHLGDPGSLERAQNRLLADECRRLAPWLRIERGDVDPVASHTAFCPLFLDAGPHLHRVSYPPREQWLQLVLDEVVVALRASLEEHPGPEGERAAAPLRRLRHQLLERWSSSEENRAWPRSSSVGRLELLHGLDAIASLATPRPADDNAPLDLAPLPGAGMLAEGVPTQDPCIERTEPPDLSQLRARHAEASVPLQWEILDTGANGYCLRAAPSSRPIQVGQPVAFRHAGTRDHAWQLGVVRWLHCLRNGQIRIGVELLCDTLQIWWAAKGSGPQEAVLAIPRCARRSRPTLAVPTGRFGSRNVLHLWRETTLRRVRLEKCRESLAGISLFTYRLLPLARREEPIAGSGGQ
ncbi:MAG TPA: hypothetical protein ENK54_03360 [Thiotrichales bacterium]|nr:hypothetical protein [Thiotrichales bacterium]